MERVPDTGDHGRLDVVVAGRPRDLGEGRASSASTISSAAPCTSRIGARTRPTWRSVIASTASGPRECHQVPACRRRRRRGVVGRVGPAGHHDPVLPAGERLGALRCEVVVGRAGARSRHAARAEAGQLQAQPKVISAAQVRRVESAANRTASIRAQRVAADHDCGRSPRAPSQATPAARSSSASSKTAAPKICETLERRVSSDSIGRPSTGEGVARGSAARRR